MKKLIAVLFSASLLAISAVPAKAQSIKDLLNSETVSNVISTVVSSLSPSDITGDWTYTGSAIELQSDNVLQKAGGSVLTSGIKSKIDTQLTKLGISEGTTEINFGADSVATFKVKNKTKTANYSISDDSIVFTIGGIETKPVYVSISGSTMTLTADADSMLTVISYISSATNNSTLKSLSSIADSYDGLRLGITLKKK